MVWGQNYNPTGNQLVSAALAAVPIAVMLGSLAFLRVKAHVAAIAGLLVALAVAIFVFGMSAGLAARAATLGAAFGLLPIGWIIVNIIFLYQLSNEQGQFELLRNSIASVSPDSRIQLLLIAFCIGAFFEGAAGFGAPVGITGAMLVGLGFSRLQASGLSLIANTTPVAFGALGTPVVTLAMVTGLPLLDLSAMVGRLMFVFALVVPFWLLVAYCGWRRAFEVWPAALVTGFVFAVVQLGISNLHGPWLTAMGAAVASSAALVLFLKVWQPKRIMKVNEPALSAAAARGLPQEPRIATGPIQSGGTCTVERIALARAWMPWAILAGLVFLWGLPRFRQLLDGVFTMHLPVSGLDGLIQRLPPVVAAPQIEKAVYNLNLLSTTGTSIFIAAVVSGLLFGIKPAGLARIYGRTLKLVGPSLLTIAAMLALGYLTRFSGMDAAMGLAFAMTGSLYPFFGTALGWLGTAVTGSDTASNVLFGSLQRITSEQLGLPPTLMAAANSAGGVMGKMIDAQSIVVASTATGWYGHEGTIVRYVFLHSLMLASLMGAAVALAAYVPGLQVLVPH